MYQRFSVSEDDYIIDRLNPANNGKAVPFEDQPFDDIHLRRAMLQHHLHGPISDLIISTNPIEKLRNADPWRERTSIWMVLLSTIEASHLNTLAPTLSVKHRFKGKLRREKVGWQDYTSVALFADDVERLLRDLYGESDEDAIDRVRAAILQIVVEFTQYVRKDLYDEYADARGIDYGCGIVCPRNMV
jgi:hypothetical protein